MGKLPSIFNAGDHDKLGEFTAIPPGDYTAMIVKSEMKKTKKWVKPGDGEFLALQFKVLEGEHKDRLLFSNLNLINESTKAVQIAQSHLASICEATGVTSVTDSDVLHNIPMLIRVTKKAATSEYPEGNEVKGYKVHPDRANIAIPTSDSGGGGGEATPKTKPRMPWEKDKPSE